MTVVKVYQKEKDFSAIQNEPLRDPELSWKATGLLAYLVSRPKDWKISIAHLSSVKTDGKNSTIAALEELKSAGYVHFDSKRNSNGRFDSEYIVFETKALYQEWLTENLQPKITDTEKPHRENGIGKTDAENRTLLNTEKLKKENKEEDLSFPRSGHSGLEAPLRVASACAPDANPIVKESGAMLISTNPKKKDSPSNFIELNQNQYGANSFVQEQLPEAKDSAPSHAKKSQSKTKRTKMTQEEREQKEAAKKAEKEAERDRKNARYYEFFGSKERYNQFYKYLIDTLEAKNTPSPEYPGKIGMTLNGLLSGHEYARPVLAGFQRWEKEQQASQPIAPHPQPTEEPEFEFPNTLEPIANRDLVKQLTLKFRAAKTQGVPEEVSREIWEQLYRAYYPTHILAALDGASLNRERYEFCLEQMIYQSNLSRLKTIERKIDEQAVENYRKRSR